ncbi:ABC transporter substrate-binding protein [Corynebacterium callunae]|uniref:ABC transporter substrate-binding protein n=1 Tax=Corynebacterium callunae TaxID=1721 RepID=UPI0039819F3C
MKKPLLATTLICALGLGACASETPESAAQISVENCGATVSFDAAPEKVALMDSAAVPTLDGLGVLDRVVAKAGAFPAGYYREPLASKVAAIPSLSERVDATGHVLISKEVVVAAQPDLVIGETDTINRATLASNNIPVVDEPAFCGSIDHDVTFDDVWSQIDTYGTIFDHKDQAASLTFTLQQRLAELEARAAGIGVAGLGSAETSAANSATNSAANSVEKTVAVLYPTIGGGVMYAYGRGSMSNPLVESAGLHNVFADQSERVFEITAEELISRNPDYIIVLHSEGDAAAYVEELRNLQGANALQALNTERVLPLFLNFAEPPSPLALDGLEKIIDFIETQPVTTQP